MEITPGQVVEGVTAVEKIAELELPVLAPLEPIIALVMTAIMAHFNATKTWPTTAQVLASLPADYQQLESGWAGWKPSGDGTLPAAPPAPTSGAQAAP